METVKVFVKKHIIHHEDHEGHEGHEENMQ